MRSTLKRLGRHIVRLLLAAVLTALFSLGGPPVRWQGWAAPPEGSTVVTAQEARTAAENWLRFILGRDGQWGSSRAPSLGPIRELRRGAHVVAYYVAINPQGYIALSPIRDFAPIMAYSTESDLDPDEEAGMASLLRSVGHARVEFALQRFGALHAARLAEVDPRASTANRQVWSRLLQVEGNLFSEMGSSVPASGGRAGPLLSTRWSQRPPYNDRCPAKRCEWGDFGGFNQNAVVGCVPLAMAQIMRYFAWPPAHAGRVYQWPRMLEVYQWDSWSDQFADQDWVPVTQAQIDAVAELCADVGSRLSITYGCKETSAYMCNWYYNDARDAFEDHFLYSSPTWDEPSCEDRDSYEFLEWWHMITGEVEHNRPMLYRIADTDFAHCIVVDGYDHTSGQYLVHANYGWGGGHNGWYALDDFDCDGPCKWSQYEMVRMIYPRTGLCDYASGHFRPLDVPHYVYCDLTLHHVTIHAGTRLQFLPQTRIIGGPGSSAEIHGGEGPPTRLASDGVWSRGLVLSGGGMIKLQPGGSIKVY